MMMKSVSFFLYKTELIVMV